MSFATVAALLVAALVGAPIAAHLLRRRRAEERPFAPARLVTATQPTDRRRSRLEDRALFSIRALSILALALLGATPFMRCSHLSFARESGASIAMAIVVDDSLSMRAPLESGQTRFDRAREAALELLDGTRNGDAAALILAGSPARIEVATTTNVSAVRQALGEIEPSDRATELDTAIEIAHDLLDGAPQRDKRVVLLSDLADGHADRGPLPSNPEIALWIPLQELEASGQDCGIVRADRHRDSVRAQLACYAPDGQDATTGRMLEVRSGANVLAKQALPSPLGEGHMTLELPKDAPADLHAVLTGSDAISADDVAPIVPAGATRSVAVVADPLTSRVETGGPPPVERALAALGLGDSIRPLPDVPQDPGELDRHGVLIVDDAPGFTPEVRRALAAWVEGGGVLLLALGPRAATAPLGASFEPLVPGVVRWGESPTSGVAPETAPTLGPSARSLEDVSPKGRAALDLPATRDAEMLAKWTDGKPFLFRRAMGRGAVFVVTLSLRLADSDFVLRPAFLSVLDRVVDSARSRGGARLVEAGRSWTFDGYQAVEASYVPASLDQPARPLPTTDREGRPRVDAPWIGRYQLVLDGEDAVRFAGITARETQLERRPVDEASRAGHLGGVAPEIDISPYVALLLLALVLGESALRLFGRTEERAPENDGEGSAEERDAAAET